MKRPPERAPRKGRQGREAGYSLLSALFVLLLVSLALALVAASLDLGMRSVRHQARDLRLTALTDAALAEALAHLAGNERFEGLAEHPYGGGTVASEVVPMGTRRWRVIGRASWGEARRAVRVEVVATAEGLAVGGWRRVRAD